MPWERGARGGAGHGSAWLLGMALPPWELPAPGRAAPGWLSTTFNLHIKSQPWPEAVRTPLIQSELTLRPRELPQLWQRVQAAGTGGTGSGYRQHCRP